MYQQSHNSVLLIKDPSEHHQQGTERVTSGGNKRHQEVSELKRVKSPNSPSSHTAEPQLWFSQGLISHHSFTGLVWAVCTVLVWAPQKTEKTSHLSHQLKANFLPGEPPSSKQQASFSLAFTNPNPACIRDSHPPQFCSSRLNKVRESVACCWLEDMTPGSP